MNGAHTPLLPWKSHKCKCGCFPYVHKGFSEVAGLENVPWRKMNLLFP